MVMLPKHEDRVKAMARGLAFIANRLPDQLVKEEVGDGYQPYSLAPKIEKFWEEPIWKMYLEDAVRLLDVYELILDNPDAAFVRGKVS